MAEPMRARRSRPAAATAIESDGSTSSAEEGQPKVAAVEVYSCTACGGTLDFTNDDLRLHPILAVLICEECLENYEAAKEAGFRLAPEELEVTNHNGDDEEIANDESHDLCTWCGDEGVLLCCDNCPAVFCEDCVTRNCGFNKCEKMKDADMWKCFLCEPKLIKHVIKFATNAQITLDKPAVVGDSDEQRQTALDRLVQAEIEFEEACSMLEDDYLANLKASILQEMIESTPSAQLEVLSQRADEELAVFKDKWTDKHSSLQDTISMYQEQCEEAGIDIQRFYSLWDREARSFSVSEALKQAPRIGDSEDSISHVR